MNADLTTLQRVLLDYVQDDAEPTWIMLKELPETGGDRGVTEAALRDLESRGLVSRTREPSGDPSAPSWDTPDDWWSITPRGVAAAG